MSERLMYLADRAKGMLTERQARRGILNAWEADHVELAEGVNLLLEQMAERDRTIARISADLDTSVSSQIDMTDKAYRFQKALEFYADKENYKLTRPFRDDEPTCGNVSEIEYDNGKLARQALGE
ncbi:putative heme iron utilization protein [Paenibacillus sp. 1182]|uniref:hypothetical protein n=1 Tax=Paenibacillus sp. 1182 TaxID=2806565 RepID=UPI001AE75F43|nr:hypothetical protein [Paenibacillus sp. 1182]MBP1312310.1 putative heme iron utilization protein [Paenibacillus sp. 1182]